ncbi:MAG TPA: AmmeMemoRadiSam system protein B [Spirochaetes bacterium]|nr:AmmeMemoRadiSam system protein B [Spirochaetota bacterium]
MWRRKPAVAGSFYPSDPRKLSREIEKHLAAAGEKPLQGKLISLVAPHAGYVYSGPVAAFSYKHLIGSGVEVAVVLAPSHRARFRGASVIPSGIYETPLGDVPIDETIGARLVEKPHLGFIKEAHEAEHSLEFRCLFFRWCFRSLAWCL